MNTELLEALNVLEKEKSILDALWASLTSRSHVKKAVSRQQ